MYNMVVNQLVDDGHVGAASAVAASTLAQMPTKAQNNHALARRLQGRAPDTAAGGGLERNLTFGEYTALPHTDARHSRSR